MQSSNHVPSASLVEQAKTDQNESEDSSGPESWTSRIELETRLTLQLTMDIWKSKYDDSITNTTFQLTQTLPTPI